MNPLTVEQAIQEAIRFVRAAREYQLSRCATSQRMNGAKAKRASFDLTAKLSELRRRSR